jgi:hypothetical protein
MKFISHRGNLTGKEEEFENSPNQILLALSIGYDVEIDVWLIGEYWFLGHDKPRYRIPKNFLANENLWCHAKNCEALQGMLEDKNIHCFWHENDERTITSKGYVWTYTGKPVINNGIMVVLENISQTTLPNYIGGICSDYILKIKNNL